ncbi:hypothetical protein AAVH_12633 [Aphelenchoides avenae]|nr:hypothetical protein AAVH_12633 [Aphelenchus avenae]
MLGSKTNLVSDVKTAADPSAMPEAPDFGGGQSTYTSPVPLVDSKSQKDTITEKTGKKRSLVWTVIFGVLAIFFLAVTIVGALGVFGLLK